MNNGNGANGNEEGAFGELGPLATTHVCADMCAGFQYFALQYASQCFCGNSCASRSAPTSVVCVPIIVLRRCLT